MIKQITTCPHCGLSLIAEPNYITEATKIFNQFPNRIKVKLRKCMREVKKYVPSDTASRKQFNFMLKIRDSKEENIYRSCRVFLDGRYFTSGKGFDYLAAMIRNEELNKDKFIAAERKRFGGRPPDII